MASTRCRPRCCAMALTAPGDGDLRPDFRARQHRAHRQRQRGAVSIVGHILNSNPDPGARSKIELSSGTLQAQHQQPGGRPLDIPMVETGAASGDGVIRITDLNKLDAAWRPLTTLVGQRDGQATAELHQSYVDATYRDTNLIASGAVPPDQLRPQSGWRYRWTRSASSLTQLHQQHQLLVGCLRVGLDLQERRGHDQWTLSDYGRGPIYDPGKAGTTYISTFAQSPPTSAAPMWATATGHSQPLLEDRDQHHDVPGHHRACRLRAGHQLQGLHGRRRHHRSNADTYLGAASTTRRAPPHQGHRRGLADRPRARRDPQPRPPA